MVPHESHIFQGDIASMLAWYAVAFCSGFISVSFLMSKQRGVLIQNDLLGDYWNSLSVGISLAASVLVPVLYIRRKLGGLNYDLLPTGMKCFFGNKIELERGNKQLNHCTIHHTDVNVKVPLGVSYEITSLLILYTLAFITGLFSHALLLSIVFGKGVDKNLIAKYPGCFSVLSATATMIPVFYLVGLIVESSRVSFFMSWTILQLTHAVSFVSATATSLGIFLFSALVLCLLGGAVLGSIQLLRQEWLSGLDWIIVPSFLLLSSVVHIACLVSFQRQHNSLLLLLLLRPPEQDRDQSCSSSHSREEGEVHSIDRRAADHADDAAGIVRNQSSCSVDTIDSASAVMIKTGVFLGETISLGDSFLELKSPLRSRRPSTSSSPSPSFSTHRPSYHHPIVAGSSRTSTAAIGSGCGSTAQASGCGSPNLPETAVSNVCGPPPATDKGGKRGGGGGGGVEFLRQVSNKIAAHLDLEHSSTTVIVADHEAAAVVTVEPAAVGPVDPESFSNNKDCSAMDPATDPAIDPIMNPTMDPAIDPAKSLHIFERIAQNTLSLNLEATVADVMIKSATSDLKSTADAMGVVLVYCSNWRNTNYSFTRSPGAAAMALLSRESGRPSKVMVNVDHTHITHALQVLIANAIRVTPRNGVVKVIAALLDSLPPYPNPCPGTGPENSGKFLRIAVEDGGSQMSIREQDALAQQLANFSPSASLSTASLGLYICKALTDMHGGRLGLISAGAAVITSGQGNEYDSTGSTYFIDLPCAVQVEKYSRSRSGSTTSVMYSESVFLSSSPQDAALPPPLPVLAYNAASQQGYIYQQGGISVVKAVTYYPFIAEESSPAIIPVST